MIRRLWSEQVRVTFWAWLATLGAAAMLAPLTESKRYLIVGGFGAALVAATGALLRARRVHLVFVLLAELIVAAEWALLSFARSEAALGFLPGPDSISDLRDRWSAYADVANHYAAPLPQHPDVTMALATVLVLLAVVVDVVAVSWRRAALLGLVFLAIYMTPVSILGGRISVVAFVFGALGYVFLLAADERERLTHWGRQISTAGSMWDRPNEVDEGGLRRNGTRIGLGAIALAAVLPAFIPTLSPHYFGQSGSGGPGGSGGGTVEVTNPAIDMRRNLSEQSTSVLLTVTTDDPDPEYFRLSALDYFDGEVWEVGARDSDNAVSTNDGFPAQEGVDLLLDTSPYSYQVEVGDSFRTTWLPMRYVPTGVKISEGSWRVDRTHLDVYATSDESAAGMSYGFTADVIEPTKPEMRSTVGPPPEYRQYIELPPDLPPVFGDTAQRISAGEDTPFDRARALESWFHDSDTFTYSIEPDEVSGSNIDNLEDFLVDDKTGYCEQFAASMAIMARTLGIPARVAVGFLQPDHVEGDTWEFRGTDMHAWPELYFSGVGWVRFEPTPNTIDSFGSEPVPFANSQEGSTPTPSGAGTQTAPSRPSLGGGQQPSDAAGGGGGGGGGGPTMMLLVAPLIVLGAALLVGLPRIVRTLIRRRRWARADGPAATAEAAWAEMRDRVLDLRMDWDPGATPRTIGRSLREHLPHGLDPRGPVVSALNRLVIAIEQGRYARSIRQSEGLPEAVDTVAEVLATGRTPRQRFLARWLPASLFRARRRTTVRNERLGELLVSVED
jgi:transglutaminase-like putative cysteine protease